MDDNPYSSPESSLVGTPVADGADVGVSSLTLDLLRRTKTWVRIVGVVMWIGTVLLVLGALGMLAASLIDASAMGATEEMWSFGGVGMMVGMMIGYLVVAALYLVPTIKIWSYGSRIGDLLASHSVLDLEAALDAQRSFWTFVAIAFLALIAIYVVFFIGMIFIAGLGALGTP